MALIEQDATKSRHPSSPQTRTGPDYEAEADRDRLKLRDNQQPQESSLQSPPRTLAEEILAGSAPRHGTAGLRPGLSLSL